VHELALCQAIVRQLETLVEQHKAQAVYKVKLLVGPLSGVEPGLLVRAFPIACSGSIAERAILETECLPIRIRCRSCRMESEVALNHLVCNVCGDWHTDLLSGDELMLASAELVHNEGNSHV
jgi:hydrogenase nickel incorporation protein HypA/HybF